MVGIVERMIICAINKMRIAFADMNCLCYPKADIPAYLYFFNKISPIQGSQTDPGKQPSH